MTTEPTIGPSEHRITIESPAIDGGYVAYSLDGQEKRATATLKTLTSGLPPVDGPAVELFLAAMAAWIVDRSIPRAVQPDRWTRAITIEFPVANPAQWPAREVERLLRFLSNDRWTVSPVRATTVPTLSPAQMPLLPMEANAVDLFSGGLDSFAHAASHPDDETLAVGHWDMETLKGLQQRLHHHLERNPTRLRNLHVAVNNSEEDTSRTRGFLFAAAAIAVASALRVPQVTIPENGFVALNVPLTSARLGALTTRSTHPHTLALLGEAIAALDIGITLDNPWIYATKGDITRAAIADLDGIAATVSCSHPNSDRWQGDASYSNCGYCYPCLVRRSGIEAANGGQDPTNYRHDPRTETDISNRETQRRADIYAVVARLATKPHPRDLVRTGPIPAHLDLDLIQDMRERSHSELEAMLTNGMTQQVRRNLGL
jgi:hypothetical protein